jgi:hypothetical protein
MGLHKILRIVALILGVAGLVFWAMLVAKGDDVVKAYIGYITLALVLLFVIVFVLKGVFAGNLKKTLASVGVFAAVVIVSYFISSGSVEGLPVIDGQPISEAGSKWVSTGLNTFYILAIAAIGSMVLSGVKKITSR